MPTLWRIDEKGGLAVADTAAMIAAYAEPTSTNAVRAASSGDRSVAFIAETVIAAHGKAAGYWDLRQALDAGARDGSTKINEADVNTTSVREGRHEARFHHREELDVIRAYRRTYDPNKAGSFSELEAFAQNCGIEPSLAAHTLAFKASCVTVAATTTSRIAIPNRHAPCPAFIGTPCPASCATRLQNGQSSPTRSSMSDLVRW